MYVNCNILGLIQSVDQRIIYVIRLSHRACNALDDPIHLLFLLGRVVAQLITCSLRAERTLSSTRLSGTNLRILSSFPNPIHVISSSALVNKLKSPYPHCCFFLCRRVLSVVLSVSDYMKEQKSSIISLSTNLSRIPATTLNHKYYNDAPVPMYTLETNESEDSVSWWKFGMGYELF